MVYGSSEIAILWATLLPVDTCICVSVYSSEAHVLFCSAVYIVQPCISVLYFLSPFPPPPATPRHPLAFCGLVSVSVQQPAGCTVVHHMSFRVICPSE